MTYPKRPPRNDFEELSFFSASWHKAIPFCSLSPILKNRSYSMPSSKLQGPFQNLLFLVPLYFTKFLLFSILGSSTLSESLVIDGRDGTFSNGKSLPSQAESLLRRPRTKALKRLAFAQKITSVHCLWNSTFCDHCTQMNF